MRVKIKRTHPNAKTPVYATEGAACFDLFAAEASYGLHGEHEANDTFNTGLAFEIPPDHVMLVFSRSGYGFKFGATLSNAVGVIDSDYRGEVKVKYNTAILARSGDRIAQGMIIPVERVQFDEVEELSETKRGNGGFGHTGVK